MCRECKRKESSAFVSAITGRQQIRELPIFIQDKRPTLVIEDATSWRIDKRSAASETFSMGFTNGSASFSATSCHFFPALDCCIVSLELKRDLLNPRTGKGDEWKHRTVSTRVASNNTCFRIVELPGALDSQKGLCFLELLSPPFDSDSGDLTRLNEYLVKIANRQQAR